MKFTYNDFQTFTLGKLARDGDPDPPDGALDAADISVKVAGGTAFNPGGGDKGVTLNTIGNGIAKVIISADTNKVGADAVAITYKFSEYDQTIPSTNSPLDAVTKIQIGNVGHNVLETFADSGLITFRDFIGTDGEVLLVEFKYDVKERLKSLVSLSTPTSIAQAHDGNGTGDETKADSNKYSGTFALFSLADFQDIKSAAETTEVITVASLVEALDTADNNTSVGNRVERSAQLLGLSTNSSDELYLKRILPVSDGETITVSYKDAADASGNAATVSKMAKVDLTAPALTLELPGDKSINSSKRPTLRATITDAGSGITASSINIVAGSKFSVGTVVKDPISNGFRASTSPTSDLVDATYNWYVTVTDKVGNGPKAADTRSAISKTQGDANPAVRGTTANKFEFKVDTAAPALASIGAKSGGVIDDRLSVNITGASTATDGQARATLTDSSAKFKVNKAKAGDKVTNVDAGWTATIDTVDSETQLTLTSITNTSAGGGCTSSCSADQDWDDGDSYTIENPTLGQLIDKNTATDTISIIFNVGDGLGEIDAATVTTAMFDISGSSPPASVTVGKLNTTTKEQGVLLTLGTPLATDAKPKVELVGKLQDQSGPDANESVTVTGAAAPKVLDKLAPSITVGLVADLAAASNTVSRSEVKILVTSNEASVTPTGTARYLTGDAAGTGLEQASTRTTETQEALDGKFKLTGTNSWEATLKVSSFVGNPRGLVNIKITVTDLAGNAATKGNTDPDGSDGKLVSGSLLVEFDNALNDGKNPGFTLTPLIKTTVTDETDISSPSINIDFADEGKERKFTPDTVTSDVNPDSHKKVELTSITLVMPDGTETDAITQTARVDDDTFGWAGVGLAVGSYTLKLKAKDEVGNTSISPGSDVSTTFSFDFKIQERAKFKRQLRPGLNLISLPSDPENTALDAVLGGNINIRTVATYDPSDPMGPWLVAFRNATGDIAEGSTLSSIDSRHAYWIEATAFVDLQVEIRPKVSIQAFPPTLDLEKGWNLMPVIDLTVPTSGTTIDPDDYLSGITWSAAITWDPGANTWNKSIPDTAATPDLKVGSGYWVWADKAGTLVP